MNLKDIELQNTPSKLSKLKTRLQKLEKVNVILAWDPHEKDICPSSIAKFIYNLGYDITLCHTDFKSHTAYSVKVPIVELNKMENEEIVDFMEWLGMLSLEADLEKDCSDDYVNSYVTPTPNINLGQVKLFQWRGLFTSNQIQDLVSKYV